MENTSNKDPIIGTDEELKELEEMKKNGEPVLDFETAASLIAFDDEDKAEIDEIADTIYQESLARYEEEQKKKNA